MPDHQPTLFDFIEQAVVYRDIKDFPGYRVGDDGSVWTAGKGHHGGGNIIGSSWRLRKPAKMKNGYLRLPIYRDGKQFQRTVHSLVLEAFVGPRPKGKVARHLNGIKTDCRLVNLCWGTRQENEADKILHGTSARGEGNSMAKLTWAEVEQIKSKLAAGEIQAALAREHKVSNSAIYLIKTGKNWVK